MDDQPEAKLQRGLRLAIVAIALAHLFVLSLPSLLAHVSVYRSPATELVAFVLLAALLTGIGLVVWRERSFGRWRWILLGVVFIAAVLALVGIPPRYLTEAPEWSFGVVCWAGMLLLLDYGFVAVVCFLAGHLLARLGLLAVVGESSRASVVAALLLTAGFLAYQVAIAFAATLLRRMAGAVAKAMRDEERLRTAEAVAGRLHRDRQERYAGLDTVPLLTGLAAGVLDPADDRVRIRCAVAAGQLRRLFAEGDDAPDQLMHELRACVDTAERRGVTVYLGTCGSRPEPPLPVRRALTEPVLGALVAAESQARVTVIGAPAAVTVSVMTDGDPPPDLPAAGEVTVTRLAQDGRHWVEAMWQTGA
ncbi:histidine kinase [Actinophytocola sediminis]